MADPLKNCGCESVDYLIANCTHATFWENFDRSLWESKRQIKPISRFKRIKDMTKAMREGVCMGLPTVIYQRGKCKITDGQKRIGISKMLGRKNINVLKVVYE